MATMNANCVECGKVKAGPMVETLAGSPPPKFVCFDCLKKVGKS